MSRKALLLLVPVFLTLHNLEEAIAMPAFIEKRNRSVPGPLREIIPPVTYSQFLIALLIITALSYLIALLWIKTEAGLYLLVCLQVVMLINVLAHVAMAIFLRGYAPGIITALLINLPFSIYLLRRVVSEKWLSKRSVALLFPLALLIHGPVLVGLMMLAGTIAGLL